MPGSYGPCNCCTPGSLWPEYIWVAVSGVKNTDYPVRCPDCGSVNGNYLHGPLLECGGTAEVADSECYGNVTSYMNFLESDPEYPCLGRWKVSLWESTSDKFCHMWKNGIEDCTLPVVLDQKSVDAGVHCDYTDVAITITPVTTTWVNPYINQASCLPVRACKPIVQPFLPVLDSTQSGFEAICCQSSADTCCGCSGTSVSPPVIPGAGPTSNCGCSQSVNHSNGNLNLSFAIPAADPLAPRERLFYNSSPLFGPDSPFADSVSASPPAGFKISGVHSIRLVAEDTKAHVFRCDGSIDLYRCQDEETRAYVPVHTRNSLVENVDGMGATTGWTEVTQPNNFTHEYDDGGKLKYVENPLGQRWSFNRDSTTLKSISDPLDRRMTYTYASSRISSIRGVDGRIVSLSYDASGNLSEFITPELCTTSLRYTSTYAFSNLLIARIDPDATRTSFAYDGIGWIESIQRTGQAALEYDNSAWDSAPITDQNGAVTTLEFNSAKNVTRVQPPIGNPWTITYDGRAVKSVVQPSGARTTWLYGATGPTSTRVAIAEVTADGRTTYVLDSDGVRAKAIVNRTGARTTLSWDINGQKTATVNALGQRTTVVYDAAHRPVAQVNALGVRTTTVYNATSQPAAIINPLGARTSFTYVNGQRTTEKNPLGAVWTTLYDDNNRRLAIIDPLGDRSTFIYDAGCQPAALITPTGARTTNIYSNGVLKASINPLGLRTTLVYDTAGNRIRTVSPLGRISTTVYDAMRRPVVSINPSGLRSTTVFDTGNRAVATIDPTGLRNTTIYDTCCNRPKATIAPTGARTSFAYNAVGSQIRTVSPTGAISTTVYDALNRPVAGIDPFGNRTSTIYDGANQTIATVNALNQRSTTVYNAANQPVASLNALGFRTTNIFDVTGRGVASVNPKGNRWTTVLDLANRNIASVDPLGRRTTSVYDQNSAVVASINPAGNRNSTVYNIAGQTIATVDAKGARTTSTYNADSQPVATINALGFRTTNIYDTGGRGVATVNAKGNRNTTVYDPKGRPAASVNPLGKRWSTIYNTVGQTVGSKDPLGNRSTSVYDSAGRVFAGIDPLGNRTTTVYNIASQNLATVDANGNRVSSVYDALGRRNVEINALGYRTTTIFDPVGQTAALVDARANRHSFTYDSTGAQTQLIDPLNRRTTSAYDVAGQQTLRIDARSNRTTFAYSSLSQLTSRKYPDGSRATFSYDEVGNRTLMADSTGRYTSVYDTLGQTMVTASPNNQRNTYSYDPIGTRRSLDASGAGRFTYAYDLAGQITSLRNPFGERTTFSYDDSGRRIVQRNANGTRVSTVYDAASQTTQVIHRTSGGTSLLQLDYRYDNAGNRNGVIEGGGTARTTWSYDNQNQLTSEFRTGTNAYRQTFTFDPTGNRMLKNVDGARTTYAYDPANQLKYGQAAAGRTTFSYDLTGNQRIEQPPTGNRTTTTWNYENQPVQYLLPAGSPVTMAYNGDNRRVLKQQGTDITKFVWDSVIDAYVKELDGSNVLIATYTNEPQQYGAVVSQRRGSTSHILHADALGTTRLLTDNTQTVTDMYLYDAWGNLITSSGATVNPFRWVGRYGYYWDEELSQYHVRARPYTPATGQWSTQDPAGFVDGLNMHLYVHNNPVNLTDPSGRLFGYGYGNFCGYSRKACCPPGSSKVKPIDAVDAACERHDCCVATILDLWKWTSCSAELCTEVWDAFYGGCAQSYPGNPAKINACKQAATAVGSLFCWLAPGVDPPVGGVSPG